MALSTSEIIDVAFLAVFLLLLPFNGINLLKHSFKKRTAYTLLLVFIAVRIVGNILLIAGYQEAKSNSPDEDTLDDLFTGGFVLQGLGYGFLVSSSLSLYNRAIGYDEEEEKKKRQMREQESGIASRVMVPSRMLHLVNTVATLLIIVGLTSNDDSFQLGMKSEIDTTAKVGSYLYCLVTAALLVMTSYHLFIIGPITPSSRIILSFVFVGLLPMSIRAGYATYLLQTDSITVYNVWVHLVFQSVVEVLTVVVYIALGFYLHAQGGDNDLDERQGVLNTIEQGQAFVMTK